MEESIIGGIFKTGNMYFYSLIMQRQTFAFDVVFQKKYVKEGGFRFFEKK